LNREHPEVVGAGIESELLRLEVDPRMGETFLACLNEAVEDGWRSAAASTTSGSPTPACSSCSSREALRFDLDPLARRSLQLEQRLRAAERAMMTDEPVSGEQAAESRGRSIAWQPLSVRQAVVRQAEPAPQILTRTELKTLTQPGARAFIEAQLPTGIASSASWPRP
jgi:hypothetical protein